MARRSKEINIFSMSALDLFASALGAFILLTVIMLPYFPNTGDSPALIEGIKGELTATEAELAASEQAKAEAQAERDAAADAQAKAESEAAAAKAEAEAAKAAAAAAEARARRAEAAIPAPTPSGGRRLPALDVMIAIDTTGSMGGQVEGMKRDIESMMSILQELSDDAAIGIIDFKDRCFGSLGLRTYNLRKITSSMTAGVRRFVQQTSVGPPAGISPDRRRCNNSGPDALPELIDGALREALNQNWRSSSSLRMIIIVTDNAVYADKIQQTYSDAAAFRSTGGEVSVVYATASGNPDAIPYLRTLAERGGGDFVSGASFIGTVMVALLR